MAAGSWVAPFMMAMINANAVHRSNQLLNYANGRDFVFDAMMMTGPGRGETRAQALARREAVQIPDRVCADPRFDPSFGPAEARRGALQGSRRRWLLEILFIGETSDGRGLRVSVKGDKDSGCGSKSKMIAWHLSGARCLA
jgi:hypothetical protein